MDILINTVKFVCEEAGPPRKSAPRPGPGGASASGCEADGGEAYFTSTILFMAVWFAVCRV
jgi:hypothetical protein